MSFYFYDFQQFSVTFNLFQKITANQNGAIISITYNNYDLFTSSNVYKSCKTLEKSKGGCIYFNSNKKKIIVKNSCAYKCSAYEGYFYYVTGNEQSCSRAELNETNTVECSGDQNAVCAHYYCNLLSTTYNSSYCFSDVTWCNVHSWNNEESYAEFYQFYQNRLDILYGVNSPSQSNRIRKANLISNTKSMGQYGFFHINNYEFGELYLNEIYAKQNDGYLINCALGNIIIESLVCDSFSSTMTSVNTNHVTINSDITVTFIFDSNTFCAYHSNTEICSHLLKNQINSSADISSKLFVFLVSNVLHQ